MALLEWKPEFNLGMADIDRQHKKLVDLINQLYDAMMEKKTKEVMGKILKGLQNYTIEHFGYEEKLFAEHNYIGKMAHTKTHKEFVAQIAAFKADFDAGKVTISIKILSFLKDWLINHIQGTDKEYVPYLKG